ncbi:MAG: FecCD family ABC transporter permease [Thermoplasmata archaeon]
MNARFKSWVLLNTVLLIILFFSVILSLSIGPVKVPFWDSLYYLLNAMMHKSVEKNVYSIIILDIRLPSIVLAILVGISLSSSGVTMQNIFKNPLIDPYILGLSAGSAFGAALVVTEGWVSYTNFILLPVAAFLGGTVAVLLVLVLSYTSGGLESKNMIFAGLAVGYLFSAMVTFLMYISGPHLEELIYWLLGSFSNAIWGEIDIITFPILISFTLLFILSKEFNLIATGDELAKASGVNVKAITYTGIGLSTLLTALAVSMSGIIGFVGLMIPHIMRRIVGSDYRYLLPSSALGGAILLVVSDTIARTILSPSEIPVGVITSFMGVPFFIYLYRKSINKEVVV